MAVKSSHCANVPITHWCWQWHNATLSTTSENRNRDISSDGGSNWQCCSVRSKCNIKDRMMILYRSLVKMMYFHWVNYVIAMEVPQSCNGSMKYWFCKSVILCYWTMLYKTLSTAKFNISDFMELTHWGLVMSFGIIDLGQHWLR